MPDLFSPSLISGTKFKPFNVENKKERGNKVDTIDKRET